MTDQAGVDEPQTAMLLTQTEWDDLAEMIAPYKFTTLKAPHLQRQRRLAERIIEANQ